jgi:hypothetical protein
MARTDFPFDVTIDLSRLPLCTRRPYWRCYYPGTNCIIFVVDSADVERLSIAKKVRLYAYRNSAVEEEEEEEQEQEEQEQGIRDHQHGV